MQTTATSLYHPTGTCKMGPSTDKMAVVNDRLLVHGLKRLRIADASIMPYIPHGKIQVPQGTGYSILPVYLTKAESEFSYAFFTFRTGKIPSK